jgi:hypothetical protein
MDAIDDASSCVRRMAPQRTRGQAVESADKHCRDRPLTICGHRLADRCDARPRATRRALSA